MSLLTALLDLERHAEGRRVEITNLMEALGRLLEYVLHELREGEYVTVEGRTYIVEVRNQHTKVLTVNRGVLGPRSRSLDGVIYASLEDNTTLATHAEQVVTAFATYLREQRQELYAATGKAVTGRP